MRVRARWTPGGAPRAPASSCQLLAPWRRPLHPLVHRPRLLTCHRATALGSQARSSPQGSRFGCQHA
eukprot:2857398-Lingulodinium_polyedra.AAC.1